MQRASQRWSGRSQSTPVRDLHFSSDAPRDHSCAARDGSMPVGIDFRLSWFSCLPMGIIRLQQDGEVSPEASQSQPLHEIDPDEHQRTPGTPGPWQAFGQPSLAAPPTIREAPGRNREVSAACCNRDVASRVQLNGARHGAAVCRSLSEEVRRLREDTGISQRTLARAAGVPQSVISRFEAGRTTPDIETLARLAVALGSDLSVRLFPNTGPAIRDRHQTPIAQALLAGLHPRWKSWVEVGVRRPVRGWIDVVLVDPDPAVLVASEVESTTRRLEQTIRWSNAKADALDSSRAWPFGIEHLQPRISQLLVLRASRGNREVAAIASEVLRVAYPADPWQAIASLCGTSPWPGSTMLWAIETRDRGYALAPTPTMRSEPRQWTRRPDR